MRVFAFGAIALAIVAPVAVASAGDAERDVMVLVLDMLPSAPVHPGVAFLAAATAGMMFLGRAQA